MPKKLTYNFDNEYYTPVPQSVIQGDAVDGEDHELYGRELNVWMYLLNQSDKYRIGQKQIAERFDCGTSTVDRTLQSLEEKGFLYRDDRNSNDGKTGNEYVVAHHPQILKKWLENEGLLSGSSEEPSAKEPDRTPEPDPKAENPDAQPDREPDPNREPEPDRAAEPNAEPDRTIPRPLTERYATVFHVKPQLDVSPERPNTDGFTIFTDPPYLSDRHPIRHSLPYNWRELVDRPGSLRLWEKQGKEGRTWDTPRPSVGEVGGYYVLTSPTSGPGGRPSVGEVGGYFSITSPISGRGGRPSVGEGVAHQWARSYNKEEDKEEVQPIVYPLPKKRYSKVSKQSAGAGASLNPNTIARSKQVAADLNRKLNRWVDVFLRSGKDFYMDVSLFIKERSQEEGCQDEKEDATPEHRPEESNLHPKKLGEDLENGDPIKKAYRAIWIEPFAEDDGPSGKPNAIDHRRAEEHGVDPRRMMLLRQVAEVKIEPHSFDIDNTVDSPGRDPWAIRMFCNLAFPGAMVSDAKKRFLDEQVTHARPTCPAEWAKVLLHGIEREWSPEFPENFSKAYRHRMDIERDPNRAPMPGGRRMSQTNLFYGNGIDLTEENLDRIAPPQMNDDETHPGREMSQIHGPSFDARDLSENVEVRGSPFDENGNLVKNMDPTPNANEPEDDDLSPNQ